MSSLNLKNIDIFQKNISNSKEIKSFQTPEEIEIKSEYNKKDLSSIERSPGQLDSMLASQQLKKVMHFTEEI
jgi:hypothetical protein